MAKDPKNFTGEDVPALLKADRQRRKEKDDWSLLGHIAIFLALAAVVVVGVISVLRSLFR